MKPMRKIKPNEVMKEGVSVFIPVPVSESRISKRYDTILSGTLNPNADEIAYFQRLVKKSSGPAILMLNKPPKFPVKQASRKLGFPTLYGDGSCLLQSAGISSPKAAVIMYTGKKKTIEAVQRLRLAFPMIPIHGRAQDHMHLLDLKKAGATDAILENAEFFRDSMELQAQDALCKTDDQEFEIMEPLQVEASSHWRFVSKRAKNCSFLLKPETEEKYCSEH